MKKKLTAILMVIVMLAASMTACGGGKDSSKTALELYSTAFTQLNESSSYSAATKIDVDAEADGQKISVKMTGDISQINKSDNQIEIKAIMDASGMGQETKITAYYKDGLYYTDTMGQKTKEEMSVDEATVQSNSRIIDIPKDSVKEQSVKDIDSGKEINMTLDGQKIMDLGTTAFGGMIDQIKDSAEDMKMGDITMKVLIDDSGDLKSYDMTIPITMTTAGVAMTVKAVSSMKITKIGGVTFDFPEDLDSYQETVS